MRPIPHFRLREVTACGGLHGKRKTIDACARLLRATADSVPHNPAQERIRIDIYLKENMPPLDA